MPGLTRLNDSALAQKTNSAQEHDLGVVSLLAAFLALVAAIYCAYQPVFFNFFAGDDYAYLPWLRQAMQQPELIWRNFHHPWMDSQLTQFYRPMITATMALEYFFWGANSLAFRLTNLGCLALASGFLGLISWDLARLSSIEKPAVRQFAIVAAFLFALYPLHPEATVWLIGRVDSMCTMFFLASLWYYIRWRSLVNNKYLVISLCCSVLAFTCKETSIALAPTIVLCEIVFGKLFPGATSQDNGLRTPITELRRVVAKTAPYVLLLAGYFLLRLFCFGTFVGGYDNSLALNSDLTDFASRFIHGLRMLAVPINKEMLGEHNVLVKVWEVGIALCGLLSIASALFDAKAKKLILFAFAWFILALIPVYKVFMVDNDLQGSRLGYLASAPLCIFIACGALFSFRRIFPRMLFSFYASMIILAGFMLYINNKAWAEAGHLSNEIQKQITAMYDKLPGDPPVIIVGLPGSFKGAFVSINAIDGMTKSPQLKTDRFNCTPLEDTNPIFPFGFVKDSIWQNRGKIACYYWNTNNRTLEPANIAISKGSMLTWQGSKLKELIDAGKTKQQQARPKGLELTLTGLPCWSSDCISVGLRQTDVSKMTGGSNAILFYKNDIIHDFKLRYRTQAALSPSAKEQNIVFVLRGLPEWSFGGTRGAVRLSLPPEFDGTLKSISIEPSDAVMPKVTFGDSGFLDLCGKVKLDAKHHAHTLVYDERGMKGAVTTTIEISKPSTFFEQRNSEKPENNLLKTIELGGSHGTFVLGINEFPVKGLYQLRLRAKDRSGAPLGVASDHIVVSVD